MDPISIVGRLIKLAEMTEPDIIAFYDWFWNSPPEKMTCWPVEPMTLAETLERFHAPPAPKAPHRIAVRRLQDDAFVGRISFFNLNPRSRSAEIGYLLGPAYRGMGYASEALALLLEYLFSGDLKLNRIHAQTGAFNAESVALLEKHGFKLEGRLRRHHEVDGVLFDDLLYGILAEDYFALHPTAGR